MLTSVIYCRENLELMRELPEEAIDLIYIDPPFFSNQQYEVIFGDGAEIRAFRDRWKGGINVYVEWMAERLKEMHRLLKPTGSIYVHLDWHAVHYISVEMDRIFGRDNFRNEIIWHYRRWSAAAKQFQRLHDTILFYAKSGANTFNPMYEEYTAGTMKRWKGIKRKTTIGPRGELIQTENETGPKGATVGDVWRISVINPAARERLGYPTQKPEALLECIIKASSNPGDIVADFFCGCGTTLAVAQKLGRRWIGCDVSPTACKLMRDRVVDCGARPQDIHVIGLPMTPEELKEMQPFEFQNYIIGALHGRHADRKSADFGIDGWTFMEENPIQVKRSEKVGRPEVQKFSSAVRAHKKQKGLMVAFSFSSPAHEEAARLKREEGVEIELKAVQEVLL